MKPGNVLFFASNAELRRWLADNHASATDAWLGFHKKGSDEIGVGYAAAVDEALCFGWIDGQTHGIDERCFTTRFTPRRKGSRWSQVNIGRVAELEAAGRMQPAGFAAFRARDPEQGPAHSGEAENPALSAEMKTDFSANDDGWRFWLATPPGYRRVMPWWVISAKRQETRARRLDLLISESAAGRRIDLAHVPPMAKPVAGHG